ncbi:MAG: beta-N-acetylhexosaminidase [Myxococcota bacterium]
MSRAREIERLAWGCVVIGFDGLTLTSEARDMLSSGAGGAILFRRNVESAGQVRELTASIHEAATGPGLVSVDQEGGRVARLRGIVSDVPSMRELARSGAAAVEEVGRHMAAELKELGFDIVFAPVADVDTNPDNPVIGDRSFSSDPGKVAELAVAMARGLQEGGVAACGKHFPGHGDTETDSHLGPARVPHDRARLDAVELIPFRALCQKGIASIMTAHVSVQAIDPERPATMSPKVLSILRDEMRFDGVVFTDDMEMEAVAGLYDLGEAAVLAMSAGCDQLLICHRADRQQHVAEALIHAVESGRLPVQRLEQAAERVDALSKHFRG